MKIFVAIIFITLFWMFVIEPNILVVKTIKIKDPALAGLKIVFATDFHYKSHDTYRLKRTVKTINAQKPDLVLFGGDFVNGHRKKNTLSIEQMVVEFDKINSTQGIYTVLGNHDVWQDEKNITNVLNEHNIKVLKNSNVRVKNLYIAGVEDMQTSNPDVEKALENTKGAVILLSHTPDIINEVPENVTLTLAGHLHGGQIRVPFRGAIVVPSKFGTKYSHGFFKDNKLIVSKGLGTSIIHARFACFPEIVLIEFISEEQEHHQ